MVLRNGLEHSLWNDPAQTDSGFLVDQLHLGKGDLSLCASFLWGTKLCAFVEQF